MPALAGAALLEKKLSVDEVNPVVAVRPGSVGFRSGWRVGGATGVIES